MYPDPARGLAAECNALWGIFNVRMYEVFFYTCAIILSCSCMFYVLNRKLIQKAHSKVFLFILVNITVVSAADLTSHVLTPFCAGNSSILLLRTSMDYIYFFMHNTLSPAYTLYIMLINGSTAVRKKGFRIGYVIPAIITELLTVANLFTGVIFHVDANGIYHRGVGMPALYVISCTYLFVAIYYILCHRKSMSSGMYSTLWFFFSFSLIGIVVQAVNVNLPIESFAEALSMLGIMLTLENEDTSIDPISGAYNRSTFMEENRRRINSEDRYSVISVNFTNYKFFARMFGYDERSHALRQIASWMMHLAPDALVYRLSDSNFTLLTRKTSDEDIDDITAEIAKRFEHEWKNNDSVLQFNIQIRVAVIPDDGVTEPDMLLELADDMDSVKSNGVQLQRGKDLRYLSRRVAVENALRRAFEEDRFEVYYQPIWFAGNQKIYSAEALLRLNDPDLGFIPPDEMIPIAERNGQIDKIGITVFEKVCAFIADERFKKLGLKYVEINLSLYQLVFSDTLVRFDEIMKSYGVTSDQINLEITESASLTSYSGISTSISALKSAGFSFSLDDYGTGYSNLTNIVNMDFLNIKSDKGLLWAADESSKHLLVDSIRMMRRLGMNVIQEGVETSEQLDLVLNAGANLVQGYYFSKPLPKEDFIDFTRNYNKKDSMAAS